MPRRRRSLPAAVALLLTALAVALTAPAASAAPAAPTTTAAAAPSLAERKVFNVLNNERVANGLPRLNRDARLVNSALAHNRAMSAAGTLSHQEPGEKPFYDRISAAGYTWSSCAENIGYNTDVSDNGAVALEKMMYAEKPPNDGHRRNILSTSLVDVGVSVLVDANHKLWLTVDFGAPR